MVVRFVDIGRIAELILLFIIMHDECDFYNI
jgi:hypothetical protein